MSGLTGGYGGKWLTRGGQDVEHLSSLLEATLAALAATS